MACPEYHAGGSMANARVGVVGNVAAQWCSCVSSRSEISEQKRQPGIPFPTKRQAPEWNGMANFHPVN